MKNLLAIIIILVCLGIIKSLLETLCFFGKLLFDIIVYGTPIVVTIICYLINPLLLVPAIPVGILYYVVVFKIKKRNKYKKRMRSVAY